MFLSFLLLLTSSVPLFFLPIIFFFAFFFLFYLLAIISRDATSSFSCPALGTMEEDELIYIRGLIDHLENHASFCHVLYLLSP